MVAGRRYLGLWPLARLVGLKICNCKRRSNCPRCKLSRRRKMLDPNASAHCARELSLCRYTCKCLLPWRWCRWSFLCAELGRPRLAAWCALNGWRCVRNWRGSWECPLTMSARGCFRTSRVVPTRGGAIVAVSFTAATAAAKHRSALITSALQRWPR